MRRRRKRRGGGGSELVEESRGFVCSRAPGDEIITESGNVWDPRTGQFVGVLLVVRVSRGLVAFSLMHPVDLTTHHFP